MGQSKAQLIDVHLTGVAPADVRERPVGAQRVAGLGLLVSALATPPTANRAIPATGSVVWYKFLLGARTGCGRVDVALGLSLG